MLILHLISSHHTILRENAENIAMSNKFCCRMRECVLIDVRESKIEIYLISLRIIFINEILWCEEHSLDKSGMCLSLVYLKRCIRP